MTTLLVIAKEPRPGRVKTRLTPPFTPREAAALAEAALADTLRTVAATPCPRTRGHPGERTFDFLAGGHVISLRGMTFHP
ncbi:hypothetical protein AB0D77_38395, partial [Streptomyces sp. NPDC048385]